MDPCPCAAEKRIAFAAAEAAASATVELLRFAREGEQGPFFAFSEETTGLLASALQAALTIEYPRACTLADDFHHGEPVDAQGPEAIRRLQTALTDFLEVFKP